MFLFVFFFSISSTFVPRDIFSFVHKLLFFFFQNKNGNSIPPPLDRLCYFNMKSEFMIKRNVYALQHVLRYVAYMIHCLNGNIKLSGFFFLFFFFTFTKRNFHGRKAENGGNKYYENIKIL